jgi:putative ABC transport system ATP-binding protein
MPDDILLDIDNLMFRWPRARSACLDIPRFRVARGERVFLFGPSGSGKTTLLGLIGGVLVAQSGNVRILTTTLNKVPAAARDRFRVDHIGFVFQQFNLLPHLSVLDNVLLPCRFSARRRSRATAAGLTLQQEAQRLFTHLDLDPELHRRAVSALSVGQQQRAAVARALIGQPDLIIADEPTSALDAERQDGFLNLLLRECDAAGTTVLFVSHDRRLAARFDRTVALSDINRAAAQEAA